LFEVEIHDSVVVVGGFVGNHTWEVDADGSEVEDGPVDGMRTGYIVDSTGPLVDVTAVVVDGTDVVMVVGSSLVEGGLHVVTGSWVTVVVVVIVVVGSSVGLAGVVEIAPKLILGFSLAGGGSCQSGLLSGFEVTFGTM
jgi:hypothetical protein